MRHHPHLQNPSALIVVKIGGFLSMKAISSSSSSPPSSSSSSSSCHSAGFLHSSCSYSGLSGGHALPACFNRRRIDGDEKCIKFVVVLAKKKKPSSSSSSSSPQASEPTPPRITSNVKENLQFLRLWKDFQKRNSGIPKPATSYRRKKLPKEDLPDDDMERYRDPTLALYHTNQGIENAVPVLLVDGYNVCGYWAKLKKHFVTGRLDIARQKLIDELVSFSMLREVKVVVVFDAMMSGLPTNKESFAGVDIIYSGESCADAWIEKEVVALKEDGCPRVWVVTSDRCQQQAAHGAGAFVWSCKALVSEIKASQKEVERMLQEQRTSSFQGKLLKHNLDSEVVDALKDLRKQLSENELRNI